MATMTAKKTLTTEANDLELAGQCSYLFEKLEKICPKNVSLTDEEIQEEVNMVRYGNKYGKLNRNWEEDLKKTEKIRKSISKRLCIK
jgi:hypothetical protein